MENYRKTWMKRQTALRAMLESAAPPMSALDLLQARFVTDYWSRRTIAGLLLMPATRHNFVHLNEAANQVGKD